MVVSAAVLILKMRTYPLNFAASLVTFDKALQRPSPHSTSSGTSFIKVLGEQSFAVSDRTNMVEFHVFYCFCSSNRQAKRWAISTITLSALGKCEKSLNLENRSSILGVGLMRGFSSQNWAKVQIFFKVTQAGLTNQRDISKSITVTPLFRGAYQELSNYFSLSNFIWL